MKLQRFHELLSTVGVPVFHFTADLKDCPYIVYQETGRLYYYADNQVAAKRFRVDVHFFTTLEFDPAFEALENLFSDYRIPFDLIKIDYGETPGQAGIIYYQFSCEV